MKKVSLLFLIASSCLLCQVTQGVEQVCKPPAVPLSGGVKEAVRDRYRIGGYVQYVCDYGFKLKGVDVIVCEGSQDGGQWNHPPPLCIRKLQHL